MRISGISVKDAGIFARLVYSIAKRKIGKLTGRAEVIEPLQVLAHHSRVLWGVGQMDLADEGAMSVPSRIKNLAKTQVARTVGCPF